MNRTVVRDPEVTPLGRRTTQKLLVALRHPGLFLTHGKERRVDKAVRTVSNNLTDRARSEYERRRLGKSNFESLLSYLEMYGEQELRRFDNIVDNPYYLALYTLVRWLRPKVIVETGVRRGVSSKIILSALKDNGVGTLYSIDLPNAKWIDEKGTKWDDSISRSATTGDLVPKNLRSRWNLILGDARSILPSLLNRIGPIDVFIHDSEHSYAHMMFEFITAWPFVRDSGLLISDDEDYNSAFSEFVGCTDGGLSKTLVKNSDGHKYGLVWHSSLFAGSPTVQHRLGPIAKE